MKDIVDILHLVRYKNLLLIALMQYTFRYGLYAANEVPLALSELEFFLLVLSTILIAAGGYVINDINDVVTDRVNKPSKMLIGSTISEKTAYNIYMTVTVMGVFIGLYLSNVIYRNDFLAIFIIVAATLYMYSTYLKQTILFGNIAVSLMLSLSILILPIFDLVPIVFPGNKTLMQTVFQITFDYAVIAFIINLLREIVKDIEDVDGDYNAGMRTLPIAIGKGRTSQIVFYASLIPIALILGYIYKYLSELVFAAGYIMFFVVAPLVFFSVKAYSATNKSDFKLLSNTLKVVILLGIVSIWAISLNISYNASQNPEKNIQMVR